MLSIRLSRGGAKKRPFYRIVVAEKSFSRDGRYVEVIGFSNPMAVGKEPPLSLKEERYDYWCAQGAKPSERVKRLHRDFRKGVQTAAKAEAKGEAKAEAKTEAKAEAKAAAKAEAKAEVKAAASADEAKAGSAKAAKPAEAAEANSATAAPAATAAAADKTD